ncbi:enoyl-CoA hydratase/isomerase family protein [Nocardia bovistercoris]|uniref:Enoyl-CoA hydratase/isomerase family protein n=1 Tax=Nocardia bovistercoris TaxID=2785916 RepID=A0A931IE60_9NOCA|nr:enoyl-CoA hydratase/isomerase family protein [Nocardia bovistercoris]MBH0779774.1 enoyl-CoA hydratase/isomerase family protein [Nocardia bovistercoris]
MSASSSGPVLLTRPAAGVRLLTLNRPRVRNAMTEELTAAWDGALDDVAADAEARVLVVTGAGECFCSGADMSWLDGGPSEDATIDRLRARMLPFYRSWLRPRALSIPVLAAVNGPVIGAGVCLALACDVRFAGPSARFSTPFAHRGTHSGMGATWLLPEAIGVTRARDMLYTGREVPADQALTWGLVTEVATNVLDRALAVATEIAEAGPIALRLTKAGLAQSFTGLEQALQWESLAQPVTMTTADIHEGILAFRENRSPRFLGN